MHETHEVARTPVYLVTTGDFFSSFPPLDIADHDHPTSPDSRRH